MSVGTSMGAYYDDAHHYANAVWNLNKYGEQSRIEAAINKQVKGTNSDTDADMVRTPAEVSEDTWDNSISPNEYMKQKKISTDPGNVWDEHGNIVDHKNPGEWGEPDLPTRRSLEPRSQLEFNELDATVQ